MNWVGRILLALVLLPLATFAVDYAVWAARGFPSGRMDVDVYTVMELKGQKEDYGEPDVQSRTCSQRLFSTVSVPSCRWLQQHREIVQRP